jgi:HEAT repeat protein
MLENVADLAQAETGIELGGDEVNTAIATLIEGDFQQRWDIAKKITKLGEAVVFPLAQIIDTFETSDPDLCWFAARALGEFNHPLAINSLVKLLHAKDEDLNAIAADALSRMGTAAISALVKQLADPTTRLLATRSLACIRSPEVIAPLQTVVTDANPQLRAIAIKSLSNFTDPEIVPILIKAIEDKASMVRREAVIGVGLIAARLKQNVGFGQIDYSLADLANLLTPLLFDLSIDVAKQAAIALGRVGNDLAATQLFQLSQTPSIPKLLKIQAIRSLGWISSNQALDDLIKLLNSLDSSDLCYEVVCSLRRFDRQDLIAPIATVLIAQLKSTRPPIQSLMIKREIALNLGLLGDLRAIDPLIELLAIPDLSVRLHAIRALKRLNPQLAHQHLLGFDQSENTTTELKAGVAIALNEWEN